MDVGDIVRANLPAADCELTGPVNVGHVRETSVLEVLAEVAGHEVPEPQLAARRAGEARRSRLDVSRASHALAWAPRVTPAAGLREILEDVGA